MKQIHFDIGGALFHLAYIFLPLILGGIHFAVKRIKARSQLSDYLFLYYIIIGVGIQGLIAGFSQLLIPERVAAYVGWPFSPFLLEVGMANLSFGILGIVSIWIKNEGWRAAVAIGYGLFLFLAGIGHIADLLRTRNLSIGNIGPTLWSDILVPVALFSLLAIRAKKNF